MGFTTIWGRTKRPKPMNSSQCRLQQRLVRGSRQPRDNRTRGSTGLHGARANDGTPLQSALNQWALLQRGIDRLFAERPVPTVPKPAPARMPPELLHPDHGRLLEHVAPSTWAIRTTPMVQLFKPDGTSVCPIRPRLRSTMTSSRTLADVAMHYWKTDLMPTMAQHRAASSAAIRRSGSTW